MIIIIKPVACTTCHVLIKQLVGKHQLVSGVQFWPQDYQLILNNQCDQSQSKKIQSKFKIYSKSRQVAKISRTKKLLRSKVKATVAQNMGSLQVERARSQTTSYCMLSSKAKAERFIEKFTFLSEGRYSLITFI